MMKEITSSSVRRKARSLIIFFKLLQDELITEDIDLAVIEWRPLIRELDHLPSIDDRIMNRGIRPLLPLGRDLRHRSADGLVLRHTDHLRADAWRRRMEVQQTLSHGLLPLRAGHRRDLHGLPHQPVIAIDLAIEAPDLRVR